MLELSGIQAGYGRVQVLFDVTLRAPPGQITCLMGRNGAGKTTVLRTIMGQLPPLGGSMTLEGADLTAQRPEQIPRQGIGYVPQGRRLFPELTVAETLEVGLIANPGDRAARDHALDLFPRLGERLSQRAGTLSGGEQQMLATARALCLRPRVLLLDEPTEGLQPSIVADLHEVTRKLRDEGVAILLVEQRIDTAEALADSVVMMANGRTVASLGPGELSRRPDLVTAHLGV